MSVLQQAINQLSQNQLYTLPESAPENVREHLKGDVLEDAVSVRARVHYTSLSGKEQNREVIIRRLIKSGRFFFLEAFCTEINEARLIKVDQILSIEDLASRRVYDDPVVFIQKRLGMEMPELPARSQQKEDVPLDDELLTAMRLTRAEMTALMFFARADRELSSQEVDTIIRYVHQRCLHLSFKDSGLRDYLMTLAPDPESFNAAIHQIVTKEAWILQMFIEYMMRLIARDGKITKEESQLAQKVISLAEDQGYEIEYEKRDND